MDWWLGGTSSAWLVLRVDDGYVLDIGSRAAKEGDLITYDILDSLVNSPTLITGYLFGVITNNAITTALKKCCP